MKKLFKALLILSTCLIILILSGYYYLRSQSRTTRIERIRTWRNDPAAYPDWQINIGER